MTVKNVCQPPSRCSLMSMHVIWGGGYMHVIWGGGYMHVIWGGGYMHVIWRGGYMHVACGRGYMHVIWGGGYMPAAIETLANEHAYHMKNRIHAMSYEEEDTCLPPSRYSLMSIFGSCASTAPRNSTKLGWRKVDITEISFWKSSSSADCLWGGYMHVIWG